MLVQSKVDAKEGVIILVIALFTFLCFSDFFDKPHHGPSHPLSGLKLLAVEEELQADSSCTMDDTEASLSAHHSCCSAHFYSVQLTFFFYPSIFGEAGVRLFLELLHLRKILNLNISDWVKQESLLDAI